MRTSDIAVIVYGTVMFGLSLGFFHFLVLATIELFKSDIEEDTEEN